MAIVEDLMVGPAKDKPATYHRVDNVGFRTSGEYVAVVQHYESAEARSRGDAPVHVSLQTVIMDTPDIEPRIYQALHRGKFRAGQADTASRAMERLDAQKAAFAQTPQDLAARGEALSRRAGQVEEAIARADFGEMIIARVAHMHTSSPGQILGLFDQSEYSVESFRKEAAEMPTVELDPATEVAVLERHSAELSRKFDKRINQMQAILAQYAMRLADARHRAAMAAKDGDEGKA